HPLEGVWPWIGPGRPPPIHPHRRTGDVARLWTGEERDHLGDLIGVRKSPDRRAPHVRLFCRDAFGDGALEEWGPNHPRGHRIDTDAELAPLTRQHLGQRDDARLRRVVGGSPGPSSQAPDRADAHDGAAALTAQQWEGALAAQEHAREHDIDLHPPVAFGHLLRWTDQG